MRNPKAGELAASRFSRRLSGGDGGLNIDFDEEIGTPGVVPPPRRSKPPRGDLGAPGTARPPFTLLTAEAELAPLTAAGTVEGPGELTALASSDSASIAFRRLMASDLAPSMPCTAGAKELASSPGVEPSRGCAIQQWRPLSQTTPSHGLLKTHHVFAIGGSTKEASILHGPKP